MDLCTDSCIFCDSKGLYSVNFSRYHKVCFDHFQNSISLSKATCIHCQTNICIVSDINQCENCKGYSCTTKSCGHISCLQGQNICLECYKKCHSCNEYIICSGPNMCQNCEEFFTEYPNCIHDDKINCPYCNGIFCIYCETKKPMCRKCFRKNSKKCENCGEISLAAKLECSHFGCFECKMGDFCRFCNPVLNNCSTCGSKCYNLSYRDCGHIGCENCSENQCKNCKVPKKACENCGGYGEKQWFVCHHEGCDDCRKTMKCSACMELDKLSKESFCQSCGESCRIIIKLRCNHLGCTKCTKNGCEICKNPPVFLCDYCHKNPSITKVQCNHRLCDSCLHFNVYELNCKHKKCINCIENQTCNVCSGSFEEKKKVYNDASFAKALPIYTCICCDKILNKRSLSQCVHDICDQCKQKGCTCEICKANPNKCSSCQGINDLFLIECQHFICRNCFNLNRPCNECYIKNNKKCPNCYNKTEQILNLFCSHAGCNFCEKNKYCYKCVIGRYSEYSVNHGNIVPCIICKEIKRDSIYLRCKHSLCIKCLQKKIKLLIFLNFTCTDCLNKVEYKLQQCDKCFKQANWNYFRMTYSNGIYKSCCKNCACLSCFKLFENRHECGGDCIFF